MREFILLYNRLTNRNIGPEVPPATVEGEDPKSALKRTFKYSFRRVYDEAAKSPDIVLVEGTVNDDGTFNIKKHSAGRMKFIAVRPVREVSTSAVSHTKKKDPKTQRFVRQR